VPNTGSAALRIEHRDSPKRKICRMVSASRMIRQFRALSFVPCGRFAWPV
jgi:hypothetical protein